MPVKKPISRLLLPVKAPRKAGANLEPPVTTLAMFSGSKRCLMPVKVAFVLSEMELPMAAPVPIPDDNLSVIIDIKPFFLMSLALK